MSGNLPNAPCILLAVLYSRQETGGAEWGPAALLALLRVLGPLLPDRQADCYIVRRQDRVIGNPSLQQLSLVVKCDLIQKVLYNPPSHCFPCGHVAVHAVSAKQHYMYVLHFGNMGRFQKYSETFCIKFYSDG